MDNKKNPISVNCSICVYSPTCYFCYYSNSCDKCTYCENCDYCNNCSLCSSCSYCVNLRLTQDNLFCYSTERNDEHSFQQKRWRAFNKEVGKERYKEIEVFVSTILHSPNDSTLINLWNNVPIKPNYTELNTFWRNVTDKQWAVLLAIPEAVDFKEGFEFISGVTIRDEIAGNTVVANSENTNYEVGVEPLV